MIIVDASVALKWFLPEAGSREAVALQSGPQSLAAPSLIRLEVASALCRAVQGKGPCLEKDKAEELCSRWFSLLGQRILELVPDETLMEGASRLAVSFGHPLADCLYLELARRGDALLVTADRVFHERARERFPKVRLLKGLEN